MIFIPKLNEENKKWIACLGAIEKLYELKIIDYSEFNFMTDKIEPLQTMKWFKEMLETAIALDENPHGYWIEYLQIYEDGRSEIENMQPGKT